MPKEFRRREIPQPDETGTIDAIERVIEKAREVLERNRVEKELAKNTAQQTRQGENPNKDNAPDEDVTADT